MIEVKHTHAGGTVVEGTSRSDGSNVVLKAHRFRWSRSLGCWYLPHSRDRAARQSAIEAAAAALRTAGHEVSVRIDESVTRSFADAEAERIEQAEARADRYADRAGRACAVSAAAQERADTMAAGIPFGQPILIGHHSENRDRRYRDRIHTLRGKAIDEDRRATHWQERAGTAERYQQHRENVPTTLRRIQRLEAEARRTARHLSGAGALAGPVTGEHRERLTQQTAELAEELTYWRQVVAEAEEAGAKVWGKKDFRVGDYLQHSGRWLEVLRVNPKSVTVPAMISDGYIIRREGNRLDWTDTLPYDKVRGRKTAGEIADILTTAGEQ